MCPLTPAQERTPGKVRSTSVSGQPITYSFCYLILIYISVIQVLDAFYRFSLTIQFAVLIKSGMRCHPVLKTENFGQQAQHFIHI